ncbi:MAG: hypothetical protein DMD81_13005 [Candidatus Rokuibacteriota bacterium]|nr:MAG: hypothetical protein DMD81_13005 [Candidatus Rokubacteria bacterium]
MPPHREAVVRRPVAEKLREVDQAFPGRHVTFLAREYRQQSGCLHPGTLTVSRGADSMRVMAYETRTRRFSRAEYERLIEIGFFRPGDPIELVGGELMVAEPQGAAHYTAIVKTARALEAAFGPGWHARIQGPLGLDDDSEPEPDVAIVPGSPDDYGHAHPSRPVLTVEVAESSLTIDREPQGQSLRSRSARRLLDSQFARPRPRAVSLARLRPVRAIRVELRSMRRPRCVRARHAAGRAARERRRHAAASLKDLRHLGRSRERRRGRSARSKGSSIGPGRAQRGPHDVEGFVGRQRVGLLPARGRLPERHGNDPDRSSAGLFSSEDERVATKLS